MKRALLLTCFVFAGTSLSQAGNWKLESKPPVLDALERQLARHLSNARPQGYAGTAYDEYAKALRWKLERNGLAVKS